MPDVAPRPSRPPDRPGHRGVVRAAPHPGGDPARARCGDRPARRRAHAVPAGHGRRRGVGARGTARRGRARPGPAQGRGQGPLPGEPGRDARPRGDRPGARGGRGRAARRGRVGGSRHRVTVRARSHRAVPGACPPPVGTCMPRTSTCSRRSSSSCSRAPGRGHGRRRRSWAGPSRSLTTVARRPMRGSLRLRPAVLAPPGEPGRGRERRRRAWGGHGSPHARARCPTTRSTSCAGDGPTS